MELPIKRAAVAINNITAIAIKIAIMVLFLVYYMTYNIESQIITILNVYLCNMSLCLALDYIIIKVV